MLLFFFIRFYILLFSSRCDYNISKNAKNVTKLIQLLYLLLNMESVSVFCLWCFMRCISQVTRVVFRFLCIWVLTDIFASTATEHLYGSSNIKSVEQWNECQSVTRKLLLHRFSFSAFIFFFSTFNVLWRKSTEKNINIYTLQMKME